MKCGVVDMGSNTVRLSIYDYKNNAFARLFQEQTTVGLASYIQDGVLTLEGVAVAGQAITHCRDLLTALDIPELFVFATASLRNIFNTNEVVTALFHATGVYVDVLSGEEEAALSFQGTIASSYITEGVLADIGGGSTELLLFHAGEIQSACSLPFGSLSLFRSCVSNLFPTPSEQVFIRNLISRELKVCSETPTCPILLGAGGTIQSAVRLATVLLHRSPETSTLSAFEVNDILNQLQTGSQTAMLTILRTVPDRIHTMIPGLIILSAVVQIYGVEQIQISGTDIREGYLMKHILT